MGDILCEDYTKAAANRERVAQDQHELYYWWEMVDILEPEATPTSPTKTVLARSRQELINRRQRETTH